MRLLLVTTVPNTLRMFLVPLAAHFRAQGWRVDALASGITSVDACIQAFDHVYDVQWSRNPFAFSNLWHAPDAIRRVVQQGGYDLVHVHTPVAAFVTRFALRRLKRERGCKVIYTAHGFHFRQGGPALSNAVFRGLETLAGRWTDELVVINQEDRQAALTYGILPADRIWYMPGIGVDTTRLQPANVPQDDVRRVRAELGLKAGQSLLLMIAEFNPGKRHRDALRAFAGMRRPDARLAFAGVGPQMEAVRALAHTLGVADRVHFLGFRNDIPALVRAATATVLPSEREGLPMSVMESLCLEVPVVGTNIRGVQDLVPPSSGLLVPVGDVTAMAAALDWLVEHPAGAQAMGRQGREQMAVYDVARILPMHEELYATAAARLSGNP